MDRNTKQQTTQTHKKSKFLFFFSFCTNNLCCISSLFACCIGNKSFSRNLFLLDSLHLSWRWWCLDDEDGEGGGESDRFGVLDETRLFSTQQESYFVSLFTSHLLLLSPLDVSLPTLRCMSRSWNGEWDSTDEVFAQLSYLRMKFFKGCLFQI